jgi:hypothetical protein
LNKNKKPYILELSQNFSFWGDKLCLSNYHKEKAEFDRFSKKFTKVNFYTLQSATDFRGLSKTSRILNRLNSSSGF